MKSNLVNNVLSFNRYADPGHSWVRVSVLDLEKIGGAKLINAITSYSFLNTDTGFCFLEEDCDESTLIKAAAESGIELRQSREFWFSDGWDLHERNEQYTAALAFQVYAAHVNSRK